MQRTSALTRPTHAEPAAAHVPTRAALGARFAIQRTLAAARTHCGRVSGELSLRHAHEELLRAQSTHASALL